jgi:hypothetical protein
MEIEERQADNRARMASLASQFPVLENAPGVNPWDSLRLDEWASGGVSHSERHAAAFVLHVWNPRHDWKAGRFDVMAALWVWDAENRRPFVEWAKNPHWE